MNPKIKICGITNYDDAKVAKELGANFIGFINYEKSPRFVSFEKIQEIVEQLRVKSCELQIMIVGVFVNKNLDSLLKIIEKKIFDVIQLHGDENLDYVEKLKAAAENVKIWKVFRVKKLDNVKDYGVDAYLFDTYKTDVYGGTGVSFDWHYLKELEKKEFLKEKIILSGGIGLDNIKIALQQDVFAVDVNSKIEKYLGKKDLQLMKRLFDIYS